MKKMLCAAIAALALAAPTFAQGPAAPAHATSPISAPATGGVVTTPAATVTPPSEIVKRAKGLAKSSERKAVLDLCAAGKFAAADSTLAALEAAGAVDAGKKEAAKEVAAEFSARADSLQQAASGALKPLSRGECIDWAAEGATPAEKGLRLEALRIRWRIAPFPKSVTDFGTKTAWLVSRPAAGGDSGGSSVEIASLRKEVGELRGKTEGAFKAAFAHLAGIERVVADAGVVKEDDINAAVARMLNKMDFSFSEEGFIVVERGDETSPAHEDGATVVLRAGD